MTVGGAPQKIEVAEMFGENLRLLRRSVGISQEELAARCSLHRTEIGILERGSRIPRIDTLIKIATALEADPKLLIAGIEWNPSTTTTMDDGGFTTSSRLVNHRALMKQVLKLREGQTETVDVAALINEAREELEQRAVPQGEEKPERGHDE